jgi:PelA/Pel-15E family pectate lyase
VTPERRRAARLSFDLGIDCILKCQVRINGTLTVWCAQHDEVTLEPRPARAFELAALSGAESAGLLLLLMSLESPSPEIIRSILAGTRWFQSSRLDGLREVRVDGDKRIVPDAAAPPLWARFYDIEKGRPIFAGRDGVKRHDYAEIESERRNGYAWYGTWGTEVLSRHPAWRRRWPDPIPAN